MRRHVAQCTIAGLAILAALVSALYLLRVPSEFRVECERIGGSLVPGVDGAADLCIGPGG
jgi:hypothetical protein